MIKYSPFSFDASRGIIAGYFLLVLSFCIYLVISPLVPDRLDKNWLFAISLCSLAILFGYYFYMQIRQGANVLLSAPSIILFMYWVINIPYVFFFSLGFVRKETMLIYDESLVVKASFISLLGFIALVAGLISGKQSQKASHIKIRQKDSFLFEHIGMVFMCISIIMLFLYIATKDIVSSNYTYSSKVFGEVGSIDAIAFLIIELLGWSGSILLFGALFTQKYNKKRWIRYWLLLSILIMLFFMVGRRTPISIICIGVFICYSELTYKKFNYFYITLMVVIGVYVFWIGQYIRANQLDELLRGVSIFQLAYLPFAEVLSSIGFQLTVVVRILSIVPEPFDYSLGCQFVKEGLTGIPLIMRIVDPDLLCDGTAVLVQKMTYEYGYINRLGIGSNVVADFFRTGGTLTVIVLSFLLGRLVIFIQNRMRRNTNLFKIFCFSLIVPALLSGMRNSMLSEVIRYAGWGVLLVWITKELLPDVLNKQHFKHNR